MADAPDLPLAPTMTRKVVLFVCDGGGDGDAFFDGSSQDHLDGEARAESAVDWELQASDGPER